MVKAEEGSTWDMVNDNDLWEGRNVDDDQEDYVVVRQEDIVDGIACFMAAYLLSLEKTKVYMQIILAIFSLFIIVFAFLD